MSACQSLIACLVVVATSWAMDKQGKELPILETFQGTVGKDKQASLPTGHIATEAKWKETWARLHPKEELPEIDFAKHFLLITTQNRADPNRQSVSIRQDEQGTVSATVVSTLIGFKPSDETIYRFHKVSRAGVTGISRFDAAQKKTVVDPLPK